MDPNNVSGPNNVKKTMKIPIKQFLFTHTHNLVFWFFEKKYADSFCFVSRTLMTRTTLVKSFRVGPRAEFSDRHYCVNVSILQISTLFFASWKRHLISAKFLSRNGTDLTTELPAPCGTLHPPRTSGRTTCKTLKKYCFGFGLIKMSSSCTSWLNKFREIILL